MKRRHGFGLPVPADKVMSGDMVPLFRGSRKEPMYLEHIPRHFEKLSQLQGLKYFLAGPAFEEEIVAAERRLNVSFPPQVKRFYQSYNGLRVDDPQLEVLPMERLDFVSPNRLHFATLDGNRRLFFDVSHLNQANQWFIVAEDDYLVTFTMASFWTRKMWAWIMEKRAIWEDECHHEEHPDHP